MKKAICKECNNIMRTKTEDGEKKYFCKYCDDHTRYEIKDVRNFCDRCGEQVEVIKGCGSISFFCDNCNELRSKKKVETKYFDLKD
ncbi:zinc ribbon domain-containing protein [Halanaerocella petrolearia]